MKKSGIVVCLMVAMLLSSVQAHADEYWDKLTECISEATSEQDKALLARWVGYSIAQHPALQERMQISQDELQMIDEAVGKLYVHLFGDVCHDQSIDVILHEHMTLKHNYAYFKQLAIDTLFSDPSVENSFNTVDRYIFENLPDELRK